MAVCAGMKPHYTVFLILAISSRFDLVSTGGYSCNCDCGPNAGGGRCSLQLPFVKYLKSGGTCQAIELDDRKQQCFKNFDAEDQDATICWTMPRTACMCREPTGNYNLMCECDGNRGIFCGSEQNNCVCEVLKEDRKIGITIGIAVGASVLGIFILSFLITVIYFIRKAQREKDPWYQFDKQFKKFQAIKEKEKAEGKRRPTRTTFARSLLPTNTNPSSSNVETNANSETKQPEMSATNRAEKERRPSLTGPNWLLAARNQQGTPTDNYQHPPTETEPLNLMSSTRNPSSPIYSQYIKEPDSTSHPPTQTEPILETSPIYSQYIKEPYSMSLLARPSERRESAIVHAALDQEGYDNVIYEAI